MKDKEIIVKENYALDSTEQMGAMANLLRSHIEKNKLFTTIVGKNYAHVEGWQYAGGLMGIYPRVSKVENLSSGTEKKWMASVELVRLKDDKVVGLGFAVCSNAEGRKKSFDEYAILSMAQTRAIGKAYRNLVGWVMKLAGYESTPKEEMIKVGDEPIVKVNDDWEAIGIQEETQEIQAVLTEMGYNSTKQLQIIKKYAEKMGFKYDGWKMTKSQAKGLLSAYLKKKLEK